MNFVGFIWLGRLVGSIGQYERGSVVLIMKVILESVDLKLLKLLFLGIGLGYIQVFNFIQKKFELF